MSQRSSLPAAFVIKTYQMVDDSVTDDIISWSETSNTFVVWKHAEFARDLLPKYFKHDNFSSFIRQLNSYGFRKIVPGRWEYAHENFKRGQLDLLATIKRQKTQSPVIIRSIGVGLPSPSNIDDLGSISTRSEENNINLSMENENLKKENENLTVELAHAKKQRENLVAFIEHNLKLAPEQINRIFQQGTSRSSLDVVDGNNNVIGEGVGDGFKLFGFLMKDNSHKRRFEDLIGSAN